MLHSFPCLKVFNLSIALFASNSVKFSQLCIWHRPDNVRNMVELRCMFTSRIVITAIPPPQLGTFHFRFFFFVLVSVWSVLLFFLPRLPHSSKTNTPLLECYRVLSWKMHVTLEQRYGKWSTHTYKNTRSLSWQRANREPLRLMAGTNLLRVICNHSGLEGEEKMG